MKPELKTVGQESLEAQPGLLNTTRRLRLDATTRP
jgi:hypothetical protein